MIFLRLAYIDLSFLIVQIASLIDFSQFAQELTSLSKFNVIILLITQTTQVWQTSHLFQFSKQFEFIIMWSLIKQPISKEYYSKPLSRSWLLSVACCLFAFVVPILILLSIGYSWNKYRYDLVQPVLNYQNYQAMCLLNGGTVVYDSSFTSEPISNSYSTFVSAGSDGNILAISAVFQSNNLSACTLQLYFQVSLSDRIPTIAVLPLQFYRTTTNNQLFISSIQEWGTVQTSLLTAIPESSVISGQGQLYYINGSQSLSMPDAHQSYAANKNVSLIPVIGGSQVNYASTTSGGITYSGKFTVSALSFLREVSLLQNIRTFVPYFIYLFILFWVFLAQPTVRWMLQNKIYRSKVSHPKLKVN